MQIMGTFDAMGVINRSAEPLVWPPLHNLLSRAIESGELSSA